MLVRLDTLQGIEAGKVTLQFRLWSRPTVKTGGRLRTQIGELAIGSVTTITPSDLSDTDARAAGWNDAVSLLDDLFKERPASSSRGRGPKPGGNRQIYRIEVSLAGVDSRVALRADDNLNDAEIATIVAKLDGFDGRSTNGPWTRRTMELIDTWPARRAPELAEMCGRETLPFKADVRKLKELGLTESLPVGYRLSPRGIRVFAALRVS